MEKKVLDLCHLTRILTMIQLKDLVERHAFGVCSYLGEKMNIASSRVRLYFIYISFVTLGSPVIFYLFLAFWVNIRRYIKRHKDAFFG
jgi:phage shock protein PspC (stress-responsive transcriptional regulator)